MNVFSVTLLNKVLIYYLKKNLTDAKLLNCSVCYSVAHTQWFNIMITLFKRVHHGNMLV